MRRGPSSSTAPYTCIRCIRCTAPWRHHQTHAYTRAQHHGAIIKHMRAHAHSTMAPSSVISVLSPPACARTCACACACDAHAQQHMHMHARAHRTLAPSNTSVLSPPVCASGFIKHHQTSSNVIIKQDLGTIIKHFRAVAARVRERLLFAYGFKDTEPWPQFAQSLGIDRGATGTWTRT